MKFEFTCEGQKAATAYLRYKLSEYEYHIAIEQDGYSVVALANHYTSQERECRGLDSYTSIQLLAQLISRTVLHVSPHKRQYATIHKEVTIAIGQNYTATITLEQEALNELYDLLIGGH